MKALDKMIGGRERGTRAGSKERLALLPDGLQVSGNCPASGNSAG